jgi:hypothetical protein
VTLVSKALQRARDLLPITGFHFDRPLVLLQSDDWGRVGVRDREGREQIRSAGLALGERPYDLYSLETADDLDSLRTVLMGHHDSTGRSPILEMNFVVANLDFAKMRADDYRGIHLLPLAESLPQGWSRPGLLDSYRRGIAEGVFAPALHGSTHFCRHAVDRELTNGGERANLVRTLWQAGTPYIYWRMPWIGYEYWDPGGPEDDRFLSFDEQSALIGYSVGEFAKLFAALPHSACAPGYRANESTHRAWAQHGIQVAQNGPGTPLPPHFDRYHILNTSRTVEFEPCSHEQFSVEACVRQAAACFERGLPAIVSLHSINFHSTLAGFRGQTLPLLDQFLSRLESRHSDLLYLRDEDLYQLVTQGRYYSQQETVPVEVTKKNFTRAQFATQWET